MQKRRDFLKTIGGAAAGAYVAGRGLPALAQRGGARGGGAPAPAGPRKQKTIGGAAAGAYVAGRGLPALAQRGGARGGGAPAPAGPRKQISIGGRRVTVIDVHSHCTVDGVAEVVKGTPFERQAGGRALGADRIALIDSEGIDVQVLTINGYWWWEIQDRGLADRVVRAQNEGLAKWVSDHKDRFVALTSVSLQFPDLAAQQLDYGVKQLGLRGATVGGHVNGESLSDPKYDPFWAKANELGVIVFMHPGGAVNIVKDTAWKARGDIGNIIGNPLETTYFGGGYLPSYFQRTEVAYDVRGNAMCANKKHPREYLKTNIMADTMVLTDEGLRHLVAEMGISQVVYGTDNPLNWPVPVEMIVNHSTLTNDEKIQILSGNLMKLLKITTPATA
ncbi:MAG: hypothetical protein DMF88_04580 [Acidobacteria bacterium]|nr:MAG: hypothetical protein DMF88_04580 [Acidobacteriota bacterium]